VSSFYFFTTHFTGGRFKDGRSSIGAAQGRCPTEQVAILSRRSPLERSALAGCTLIGGVPLHDGLVNPRGAVAFGSVNRAKGLDRLAVIILDFQPWDQLGSADQVSLFMGASRARLLLAIVSTESRNAPT
jgi:hypothetical protein